MTEIIKMIFGSHLYGTNTPESDHDYKGVFLPTKEQIYLGRIPRSISRTTGTNSGKNTPDDVDTEMYSLHYFIELACRGQTVALDMLHAPESAWITDHAIWREITVNRERFYTRNLRAFVGYALKQASKYGIKGSRLSDAKRVVEFLELLDPTDRLADHWHELPMGEHIYKISQGELLFYEVCQRKLQNTTTIQYALSIVQRFYGNYGARAKAAARNEGIDWKAVSHAIRAALQVKQLLSEGAITFPLAQAEYIKEVKTGRLNYMTEVAPVLERLMDEVQALSAKSDLPDKVDRDYWDEFIVTTVEQYV